MALYKLKRRCFILTLLLFAQSIALEHSLCPSRKETINSESKGYISTTPYDAAEKCTLVLEGFIEGGWMVVFGVNPTVVFGLCPASNPQEVYINSNRYCIIGDQDRPEFVSTEKGSVEISIDNTSQSFRFSFYSNAITWSDSPQYVMFDGHTDISAREGSIISHSEFNNGEYYPNSYDATATFNNLPTDRHTKITLKFVKFEVEHDPPCDDYLRINGTRYCGEGLNGALKRYTVRASSFKLIFHTDWITRDFGFKIQFTIDIEPPPTTLPKPMTIGPTATQTAAPTITHDPTVTQNASPGNETLTAAGTTAAQSGGSSDSSTAKNVSNMPLDDNSLLGIIGAVAALVVICIVITTVIRRKKEQRNPDEIPDTQNNHTRDTLPLSTRQKMVTGNTAENGVYILAEEITSGVPDTNSNNAGPSSRHMRTVHDIADEYQLAGPTGDQYANFESVLRNEADMNVTDTYANVTSSTKTKSAQPSASSVGLVDNDLYGT